MNFALNIVSALTAFNGKEQDPSETQYAKKKHGQRGKFCSDSSITVLILENEPSVSYRSLVMSRKLNYFS
jgi:hypothetical protein